MIAIDDFPASISVSRLRASGVIGSGTKVTAVAFGEVSFNVVIVHRHFPNGGAWSYYLCPCGRRCRILRLFNGSELACRWCLAERGFRPRVELIATPKRAAHTAPRLLQRLTSSSPARLHPRKGRVIDRRIPLEAKLRRSLIVARQYALSEHDRALKR
jgi:hypothetical protein